jgi:hypothetical protein
MDEDNAEVDWGNREEIDSDDDDNDDISEGDDMDESGAGSDEEDTIDDTVVEKFIRTFHIGGYDVEFNNALSFDRDLNRGERFPVWPTQASYTKSDDWRERNRIGIEKMKKQLQTSIDSAMNKKSFNLNLMHNIYESQLVDNEEPIVWHETILDEYWDQLEAKIDQINQLDNAITVINGICTWNVEITKERLGMLVAICRSGSVHNSCQFVNFNNSNLCPEGIVWLSKLVDVSSQLITLFIRHNRIDDMKSARCLSRSLSSHASIRQLWLTHCDLGNSPEILSVILQSDVKHINLENNNIDSLGASNIAEYLEVDPPIQRIDLDHNRLNDDDAILISQALKWNTNLRHMDLKGNNFTSIGVKALLTCVFDSSTLNAISESNHKLTRIDMFHINLNGRLHDCIIKLLGLDCTQKIMLALQDKDSLLQYLANVPVGLIPEVLAFPYRRDDDEHQHKHLNIVYSTMRWWNMPLLYSYHNCVYPDAKRKRND